MKKLRLAMLIAIVAMVLTSFPLLLKLMLAGPLYIFLLLDFEEFNNRDIYLEVDDVREFG